ncbi:glutathione S-transferase 1-like [Liolophura sinensis]|uniref:glutathione S-transferase 1-like n=1 Tax=Liolophura sinensis TaxID=3198878 RepID=UPI003159255E
MPKYKLIYFNARGFGEMARMVFAQAGVEYEDVRFERDEWPKFKPYTPFGQAPVLEVDGVQIADSAAIARYLAREFGLAGKTRIEEAQVDMFAGAAYDLIKPTIDIYNAEGEKKAELVKKFQEETAPKFLAKFESTLAENKSGFLVGDGVTWADFTLMHFMSWIWSQLPEDFATKYSHVKEHGKRVESLPKIAAWIAKRPVTAT